MSLKLERRSILLTTIYSFRPIRRRCHWSIVNRNLAAGIKCCIQLAQGVLDVKENHLPWANKV